MHLVCTAKNQSDWRARANEKARSLLHGCNKFLAFVFLLHGGSIALYLPAREYRPTNFHRFSVGCIPSTDQALYDTAAHRHRLDKCRMEQNIGKI